MVARGAWLSTLAGDGDGSSRQVCENVPKDWSYLHPRDAHPPSVLAIARVEWRLAPMVGAWYKIDDAVRIFNRATLVAFWTKHKDAEGPLRLWFSIVERAKWAGPSELRGAFGSVDFLADHRVVFDIKGNRYRIVAQVKYAPLCLVYIRFIGTHAEYEQSDARRI